MRNVFRFLDGACHVALVGASLVIAFLLRFDFSFPAGAARLLREGVLIALLAKMPFFYLAGFHRGLRRFAGLPDAVRIFLGNAAGSAAFTVATLWWLGPPFPLAVYVSDGLVCFLLVSLVQFSPRLCREVAVLPRPHEQKRKGILIYGAGRAGTELLRELRSARSLGYEVRGFLDDDPSKRKALIMGVPVLGPGRSAAAIAGRLNRGRTRVEEIIIAMPSATGREMQEALANCRAARLTCKTVPGLGELLSGKVLSAQVRDFSIVDLVGRQPVQLDDRPIRSSLGGRSVLVTGAAGSIGSELCRQIARFHPSALIAFDQAESELFKIETELRDRFPDLNLVAALGDIRDANRIRDVIGRHSVDSIFHAAAYKHVPMMESHVVEAVRNNIFGTWNILGAARKLGVTSFLMISSDKAVNPTSLMGATKRVCELIISAQSPAEQWTTKSVSVRFGNVLGSNGSVIPIFQSQIAAGGPVKVTHPDMRRYFMTTSEAVSLVLQASTIGKGSEIFVLDMGEPIRIVDLALNMIRIAGLVPHEDIDIQYTGLRPGEKLFEETNGETDGMVPTPYEKIRVFKSLSLEWDTISEWISQLRKLVVAANGERAIIAHIRKLVPEYQPDVRQDSRHWEQFAAAGLELSRNGGDSRKRALVGGTPQCKVPNEPIPPATWSVSESDASPV